MTSDYNTVYSWFFKNVKDYKILSLPDENAINECMLEWFKGALSEPYIARLFSSFHFDDDTTTFTYELATTTNEVEDELFVLKLLSKAMTVEWLTPYVNSVTNVAQMFAGKEQKFYSQANHLNELQALLKNNEISVRKLIRDRGYIYNSYIRES